MKRSFFVFPATFLAIIGLVVIALLAARPVTPSSAAASPQQRVQRAWELAKQAGSYHFAARIDQTSIPLPVPSNVGKQSRQQSVRLEGTTNLAERKMEFTLNAEGGSPLDAQSGTQIKVDGDQAYSRQGQQAWQAIDDFTSSIAPQSDFMAFLAGAKNIRETAPAAESGVARYAFDVDGPGFAAYIEKQVTHKLIAQGKLPPGVAIDLVQQFASLSGTGEIWIGADGLPIRQVVDIQFPPASQEQIQAVVQVSFWGFAALPAEAVSNAGLLERLRNALQPQAFQDAWLAGGFLGLLGIALLMGRRHKPVYAAIIITLTAAMVFGPLLQSVQAAYFAAEQTRQAQVQAQNQQVTDLVQSLNAPQAAAIRPNISPLETALAKQATVAALPFSPLPGQAAPQAVTTSTTDSDQDGLTDEQEALLGSDATKPDTDGDTIGDAAEVTGFALGGKTWYGDPLDPDTNRDSISDQREWGQDSDHDNNPDLWSFDNDSDGVPDKPDLSPFEQGPHSYDGDHPFSVQFDHLTPASPTYVEFQVRPTNPDHLDYAFSVLDWPTGDVQGQMMDEDGLTFKDVNPDSDSPQDANGDVKLIPMLEIEISGEPTNLPDEETLKGYGVSIRNITSDGSRKAAYVPLQVVKDVGDNRVAFFAKMFYLPAATWGNPQMVRMVWAVEALVDICAEEGVEENSCTEFETYNEPEIIQTYYDSFNLTGLNVREQHGTRWAIVYKDPAAITGDDKAARINQLAPLSDLVYGLDLTFLAGRLGSNNQRDFPVTEIHRRFDHTVNASVPVTPDRFGISDNILLVKELEFAHSDLAYQQISVTETKKILEVYTPFWTASQPVIPTILFTHEEYYRPLNLDSAGTYSNITTSSDGYQYTLSLPSSVASGSTLVPVEVITATALSWAPYVLQDGEWKGDPLDQYLDELRDIYPPAMIDPDPAVAEGGLMFLEEYYANIYQGYFNIVEEGEEKLPSPFEELDETISESLENWEMVYEPIKIGLESFFELAVPYHVADLVLAVKNFFANLYIRVTGNGVLGNYQSAFAYEHLTWGSGLSLLAAGVVGVAWLVTHIPPIHEYLDAHLWGKILIVAISAGFVAVGLYKLIGAAGKVAEEILVNGAKSTEFGFWGMVIVTTLLILVDIGIFIYMLVSGEKITGVQITLAIMNIIASIIVILIFAIISSIPTIGPLIVAIYNLINTILSEFLGLNITDMLMEAFVQIAYDVDPMVSLAPTAGETQYGFLSAHGISVGNGVNISFPIEVVAAQEDPQTSWELRIGNDVDYDLKGTRASIDVDGNESAIHQNTDWHDQELDHTFRGEDPSGSHVEWPMYRVHGDLTGQVDTIYFNQAGLNQEFTYDSEFGYTIHLYRCVLLIFCKDKTTSGSVEDDPPALVFDVFPATVDEFYAWDWSNNASLPFSALRDRDNDGLIAKEYSGSDPDDTQWDTDGDTLSDEWEMELAAKPAEEGGFAFDPTRADTDNDGLRDDEEARLGSDPAQGDSDGDGRTDLQEATGYEFYYAPPLFTWVQSSPLLPDSDGDGLDDKAEYLLHKMNPVSYPYSPNVRNRIPFSLQMTAGFSGFVGPGATFPLNVSLQNGSGTPIEGQLTTQLPAGLTALAPTQTPFTVLGEQTSSVYNNIQVAASVTASHLPITSTACGALAMPLVYIPFEESAPPFYNQATPGRYDAVSSPGSPGSIPGRIGKGVYFSSPYNRLTLSQSSSDLNFSGATPFSLSVWVNLPPTSRSDYFYILAKTDITSRSHGYNLYLKPNGTGGYDIGFNNEQKDFRYNQNLQPATWYNLIATSDGATLNVHVNGVEAPGIQTMDVVTGPSADPVALGAVPSYNFIGYENTFEGALDELYIFDYPLSNQEIYSLSHPVAAQQARQMSASPCDLSASQSITVTVDNDLPSASITSLASGAYLNGSGFQVIGGEAHDPTSFIRSAEISVDGGAFQPASGKESWAYTWDTRGLAQGIHTLAVRAVDAVGHTGLSNSVYVKIDRDPPAVTLQPEIWPLPLRPMEIQTWVQNFNGNVMDMSSGVASVEVLVDGGPNLPYGGWQPAIIDATNHTWSIAYRFPVSVVDLNPIPNPTGQYTLSLRATDNAGNMLTVTDPKPVVFDNDPPIVSLTSLGPTATITSPLTVRGAITDAEGGGLYGVQVALVPVEQSEVTLDAALAMHLNDPATANGQIFMDASGFNQTGYSDGSYIPQVYEPGKVDEAVKFDGVDDAIRWREALKTPFSTTLTAAMWVKVKNVPLENTTLMSLGHAAAFYWKTKGGLTFSVTDGNGITSEAISNKALTDAQWHHVLGVWTGTAVYIYVDGVQVGAGKPAGMGPLNTSSSLLTLGNSAQGGNAFGGWVDEIYFFQRAFTNQEAANLYNLGNMVWNWATLANGSALGTTWSYTLPAGPEGLYELELRGVDNLGNRNDNPVSWKAWQGEIDTPGPRITLQAINQGLTTQVRCSATDFNLSRSGYQCPCTTLPEDMVTYDQVDNWYKEVIINRTRLYKILSTCDVSSSQAPFFMQACDMYGACSSATSGAAAPEAAADASEPSESSATPEALLASHESGAPASVSALPVSALVDPVDHSVLTSLDPLNLTVHAEAASGLQAITLTVDGSPLTSFTFPGASVTGYVYKTTWTPAPDIVDGAHIFTTSASDWTGRVQERPFTSTIFIDTQPPTIDINPSVYTTSQMVSNWGVNLTGPVSDLAGLSEVQISPAGSGIWYRASVIGDQWSYPRRPITLPDGQTFDLDLRATDLGGHTTRITRSVTADLVPPSPVTITLAYVNSQGALTQIIPGQTIYDVPNPEIQINWTPATDGSGLRRYYAGLSQANPPDLASLIPVDPTGAQQVNLAAAEAQAYTAYVVSEDHYGNRSWNQFGPLYTDTPLTPDLIAMPAANIYRGWMDSGESQIGLNRLLADNLPPGLSLNQNQKFYLSWDAQALRMAWLGADWGSDGDLFIYLKTGSGPGTDQAYNPYPATAGDTLTLPFAADTLVWVTGSESAQFLQWDGAAWSDALPGGLPAANFRITAHYPDAITDLYLPFDLLGIVDPSITPLDLIAFGSQKDALRLWTVFPILNPHDSPILSRLLSRLPDLHHLVMVNAFHWDNLALQQSPNLSHFLDADVRGLLRADPVGRITDSRVNSLYRMLSPYLFPASATPLMGEGQVIHYKFYYLNASGAAKPDDHLLLDVTSTGPIELPGGTMITKLDGTTGYHQVLDLGPMHLGDTGTVEFTGVVKFGPALAQYHLCLQEHSGDPAACQDLRDQIGTARIDADLKTSAAEDVIIDRFTAEHALAVDPPADVAVLEAEGSSAARRSLALSPAPSSLAPSALEQALAQPPIFVRSGVNILQGTAVDPSGVSSVKVQILDPDGNTMDSSCQVDAPDSGKWSCAVNLPGGSDGARYFAHVRATNTFGYASEWSNWRVLVIDMLPPTVSLDPASRSALTANVIGPATLMISGEIQDNHQARNVDVCLGRTGQPEVERCKTVELSVNNALTGTWSAALPMPPGVDYSSLKLSLYGRDAAGNRSNQPLETAFWLDTASPAVTVTTVLSSVSLADYIKNPLPILAGTASDGGGSVEIVVRMTSPENGTQRTVITVEDGQWRYIPMIGAPGVYNLTLQARDTAGNLTSLGSWTLLVDQDRHYYWFPFIQR